MLHRRHTVKAHSTPARNIPDRARPAPRNSAPTAGEVSRLAQPVIARSGNLSPGSSSSAPAEWRCGQTAGHGRRRPDRHGNHLPLKPRLMLPIARTRISERPHDCVQPRNPLTSGRAGRGGCCPSFGSSTPRSLASRTSATLASALASLVGRDDQSSSSSTLSLEASYSDLPVSRSTPTRQTS